MVEYEARQPGPAGYALDPARMRYDLYRLLTRPLQAPVRRVDHAFAALRITSITSLGLESMFGIFVYSETARPHV